MRLATLLGAIIEHTIFVSDSDVDADISGICCDSRTLAPGVVFVALCGDHVDGHRFVQDACDRGAQAIIVEKQSDYKLPDDIVLVQVDSTKRCFSLLSACFFDYPSTKIPCIGITGTNGKSTLIQYFSQLLAAQGIRVHYLSTVGSTEHGRFTENQYHLSTPDAFTVQKFIANAVGTADIVLLEATSHALSTKTCRLEDVVFASAIITNITHEHLDFHKSFERYTQDKLRLVNVLLVDRPALHTHPDEEVNRTNRTTAMTQNSIRLKPFVILQSGESFEKDMKEYPAITRCYVEALPLNHASIYSSTGSEDGVRCSAEFAILDEDFLSSTIELHIGNKRVVITLPISGLHNIKNAVMAILASTCILPCNIDTIYKACSQLRNPKGRMQIVQNKNPLAIVDFAHSPDAFQVFLSHAKRHTKGRLIVVFGSAGERDRQKRAMQGSIAATYANIIILCNEDPRAEEPEVILNDIFQGVQDHPRWKKKQLQCTLIPDRKEAIYQAVAVSQKHDTLCTLGKGHETSILHGSQEIAWDEGAVLKQALKQKRI